jgi:hypothetical protein
MRRDEIDTLLRGNPLFPDTKDFEMPEEIDLCDGKAIGVKLQNANLKIESFV